MARIRLVRQACDPKTFEIQNALPLRQPLRRPFDPHQRGPSVRQGIDFRPQGDVSPKLRRCIVCCHGRKDFARRLATGTKRLQGKGLEPSQSGCFRSLAPASSRSAEQTASALSCLQRFIEQDTVATLPVVVFKYRNTLNFFPARLHREAPAEVKRHGSFVHRGGNRTNHAATAILD